MATEALADNPEILRRASRVITHFGADAWARCAEEVCHLLEIDDLEAAHQCRLVLTAIGQIQFGNRPDDVTRH